MSRSPLRRRKDPAPQDAGGTAATATVEAPEPEPPPEPTPGPQVDRRGLGQSLPVLLVRAAHPRVGVLTAGGLAIAAALAGRPGREVALVLATVLVGQALLGWFNDLVDRRRDAGHAPSGKPLGDGRLDPGTVWFAFICGLLLLVPLAVSNGVVAGGLYLASVAIGLLGNLALRKGWFSWVTWAAAYALYPAFLSYGGWGGQASGEPPQFAMVAVAAAVGVGVHVLCALPGLVADHEDGYRHLTLRIALRIGAPRLLLLASAWTAAALIGLLVVGNAVGLSR
jgi:hypothetical protein